MSGIRKVFQNTIFLSASNVLTRIIIFLTMAMIARYLGNCELGIYSFAFAVVAVVWLAELGIYTGILMSIGIIALALMHLFTAAMIAIATSLGTIIRISEIEMKNAVLANMIASGTRGRR